jgi:hypothetical protein
MKNIKIKTTIIAALVVLIMGCEKTNTVTSSTKNAENTHSITHSKTSMRVYKSPTCGCCTKWMDHIEASGFETSIEHPNNLSALKDKLGIGRQYRSCHTAVTEDGYVFEGHIPARYIEQFLANPPADSIGLSVPGMPVGSPGMEVGDKFMAYQIHLLKKEGSSEVFATVRSHLEQ